LQIVLHRIYLRKMSRRRARRAHTVNGSQSDAPQPAVASSDPPALPSTGPAVNAPLRLVNAFKALFEKAANMAKDEVASTGKVGPRAIFVYENEALTTEAGPTKTVSLFWNDELHKEILISRIREKALMEHASAVLTLTEAEPESRSRPQRKGMLMLSGATPGMNLSARVDYALSNDAKSITSWEMRYLDKPVQNVFLDGIFPMGRGPV
jgi:hypothetical protein